MTAANAARARPTLMGVFATTSRVSDIAPSNPIRAPKANERRTAAVERRR
jgi:hypothetical protein